MTEQAKPSSNQDSAPIVYHLSRELDGQTLAAALKSLQPTVSWGQVKRWITQRYVQVNGNLCLDIARRVQSGDCVRLETRPLAKPTSAGDIRLAYWDEHLLIVEKPAGINSVRHNEERHLSVRRRQLQPSLDELLPPVLAKIQRLRWPPLPPKGQNKGAALRDRGLKGELPVQDASRLPPKLQVFPVHRLDRHTSGLMLFARTRECEQRLVTMFRRHTIVREYVAVCYGVIQPQTIQSMLIRDRGDGLRGSLPEQPTAEQLSIAEKAVTHVVGSKPIAGGRYSLLRCRLETGRTHQIRIHLSEAGHRLCGESIYNRDMKSKLLIETSGAPRQALHSDRLALTHPITGQNLKFEMPWPQDLAHWIRGLTEETSLESL